MKGYSPTNQQEKDRLELRRTKGDRRQVVGPGEAENVRP